MSELKEFMNGRKCQGFDPQPYYSKVGDFLTYYFRDDECYAVRVDDTLTVYLTMDEKELAGFKIKGVCRLLETLDDYKLIQWHDDESPISLAVFVLAGFVEQDEDEDIETLRQYQLLARNTKEVFLEKRQLERV